MTAAVGRTVRSGAVTQAERDTLARKVAAAQAKQAPTPAPAAAPPKPSASSAPRSTPAPAPRSAPAPAPRGPGRVETAGQSAAGLILGLLVWGWIILPLVRGGPAEVRDTIRAKFINKGPDGGWLP